MLCVVTGEISHDPAIAISLAAEWGVSHFEIKSAFGQRLPYVSEEASQVLHSISCRKDVRIVALSPGLFDRPMSDWQFPWDAGWKLDQSLYLCNKMGARTLVVFGVRKTGAESFQQVVDHFGDVAARAANAGVTVAVEPHRGNWVETAASGAALFDAVGSENLGFNWDVANCRHAGEPPAQGYPLAKPWLKHVHLKGSRTRPDGTYGHAVLGEDDLGWPELFRRFAADGIDVPFSVETHVKPGYEKTRACVANAKKMMADAGLSA